MFEDDNGVNHDMCLECFEDNDYVILIADFINK